MADGYDTFALQLPSGGWVEVRRPSPAALIGSGRLLAPLLAAAVQTCADPSDAVSADPEKIDSFSVLRDYCEAVLVSPRMPEDVRFEEVPFSDVYALYGWAVTGHGTVRPHGRRGYTPADFQGLVRGDAALHLDMMCHRYSSRPSVALDVVEAFCSVDLDLAVAYRGLKRESDANSGEVEVEDVYGNKHKVPRKWLPEGNMDAGAEVVSLAGKMRSLGRKEAVFSAGGEYGDGRIDLQPEAGSTSRSQFQ